jgi:hypothetical protein
MYSHSSTLLATTILLRSIIIMVLEELLNPYMEQGKIQKTSHMLALQILGKSKW